MKNILVYNRQTQNYFTEIVLGDAWLKRFYGNPWLFKITDSVLTNPFISQIAGAYNDSRLSATKIPGFIQSLDINTEEIEKPISEYSSLNDFFARKLKPESRPIHSAKDAIVSPGDGRLWVCPNITNDTVANVKWAPIVLSSLFQDTTTAKLFSGGSCAILRLCPSDYHRLHYPYNGVIHRRPTNIDGVLHSVNPWALEKKIPVYTWNKRMWQLLETDVGTIGIMEVGALFVGSMVQTKSMDKPQVIKGEEKSFFKFGGSTCILFFQKNSIQWDADIVEQSAKGIETYVQLGEKIATKY
jgi:phosphatidylserine decarboxylase